MRSLDVSLLAGEGGRWRGNSTNSIRLPWWWGFVHNNMVVTHERP